MKRIYQKREIGRSTVAPVPYFYTYNCTAFKAILDVEMSWSLCLSTGENWTSSNRVSMYVTRHQHRTNEIHRYPSMDINRAFHETRSSSETFWRSMREKKKPTAGNWPSAILLNQVYESQRQMNMKSKWYLNWCWFLISQGFACSEQRPREIKLQKRISTEWSSFRWRKEGRRGTVWSFIICFSTFVFFLKIVNVN